MFARAILLFAVVFLAGAGEPAKDAKKELEKLQGEWTLVSWESPKMKLDDDAIKKSKLVIKGSEWLMMLNGKEFKFTFKIDPAKSPKEIDLGFEGKKEGARGIYKIDGDTLTFCRPFGTPERPKEFKAGEGVVLIVCKRSKK